MSPRQSRCDGKEKIKVLAPTGNQTPIIQPAATNMCDTSISVPADNVYNGQHFSVSFARVVECLSLYTYQVSTMIFHDCYHGKNVDVLKINKIVIEKSLLQKLKSPSANQDIVPKMLWVFRHKFFKNLAIVSVSCITQFCICIVTSNIKKNKRILSGSRLICYKFEILNAFKFQQM